MKESTPPTAAEAHRFLFDKMSDMLITKTRHLKVFTGYGIFSDELPHLQRQEMRRMIGDRLTRQIEIDHGRGKLLSQQQDRETTQDQYYYAGESGREIMNFTPQPPERAANVKGVFEMLEHEAEHGSLAEYDHSEPKELPLILGSGQQAKDAMRWIKQAAGM